jgi:ABC-2 type transport system ATP-binding protein
MEPLALPTSPAPPEPHAPAIAPAPEPDDAALSLIGITKSWKENRVLDGAELVLAHGTAVRVSGRNGAGKTTLLRIAAGLIAPDSGKVAIGRLDPIRDRRHYHSCVGFLSAGTSGLYARLTARQHLEMWSRLCFVPRNRRAATVAQAIARFGLEDLAKSRVDRLSMGQRQRVRLALAFMHDPILVLLDEPRNSLDEEGLALVVAAVKEVVADGGVAVWCCPDGDPVPIDFDRDFTVREGRLEPR